ncbi:hypothetical protein, partial [Azospirillum doebereinerae]
RDDLTQKKDCRPIIKARVALQLESFRRNDDQKERKGTAKTRQSWPNNTRASHLVMSTMR